MLEKDIRTNRYRKISYDEKERERERENTKNVITRLNQIYSQIRVRVIEKDRETKT